MALVRRPVSSRLESPPDSGLRCVRRPLSSSLPPERALLWLRGDRRPFALAGQWLGGAVILGSEPARVAEPDADPFALLELEPLDGDEVAVGGGWVGWLGYGLGARIERTAPSPPAPCPRAGFSLAFHDHVVFYDGERWWFEALWTAERDEILRRRHELWERRLRQEPPPPRAASVGTFAISANGPAGHVAAVAECRRRIAAGELYQANLCLRLEASFAGDPLDLLARALPAASPRFGALLDGALSLSPERFLRRQGRDVWTEPIKGTRPRTGEAGERERACRELAESAKDAAEHVMIVDLMRNDLGRVCEYGTVSAAAPRVEAHAGVWHLVSTVSGRLRDGAGDAALLRATFPPGSVTGAPKVQAMKVISELEATRRELYTGAIGIASPIAGLDLSVAIRVFELEGGRIWFGAGGGIVADSDPELELAEALAKAAGPIAAIGGSLRGPTVRRLPGHLPQRALRHGRRPDSAQGVFETVLVSERRAVDLDAHLSRLSRSLARLYGAAVESSTRGRALAAAASTEARSRLRILADPDGSVSFEVAPVPESDERPLVLAPYVLPGGLGAHKWRDRRLLEALAGRVPGTVPLIVDSDGLVLEAAHANVWLVEEGVLVTPPADGRILPGVTRARLLAAEARAREEPVALTRLAAAAEIFLTSSIAGRRAGRLSG